LNNITEAAAAAGEKTTYFTRSPLIVVDLEKRDVLYDSCACADIIYRQQGLLPSFPSIAHPFCGNYVAFSSRPRSAWQPITAQDPPYSN
jgi:hypothetical protein